MTTTFDEQYGNPGRGKFLIGGLLILVAVVYLIISSTSAAAQYFFTVDELFARGSTVIGTPSKVTGAVLGETIQYDAETLTLSFTIAHMPADNELLEQEGGLAQALNAAVNDPSRTHMRVEYVGPKPDLLRHEAQAILTGTMAED
ncbi:MAG: cytochrome c maturation protein CcmE, partial [Chloroflexota bacterium]